MRKKIAAANWKMYKTPKQAREFFSEWRVLLTEAELKEGAELAKDPARAVEPSIVKKYPAEQVEIVFFPSAVLLPAVSEAISEFDVDFGPQNIGPQKEGAFTGETSADVAKELGATYALIGHSERRTIYKESNEMIAKKVAYAAALGLIPMLCVGETIEERDKKLTEKVIAEQLTQSLSQLPRSDGGGPGAANAGGDRPQFVLAYEPVWAIGTGKVATPEQAEEAHTFLRKVLTELRGPQVSEATPILYGGSVKPENAVILSQRRNIDGFLVGGASLVPKEFWAISRSF